MFYFFNQLLCQLLVMIFIMTGCTPTDVSTGGRIDLKAVPSGQSTSGANAGTDETTSVGSGTTLPPKVEIRHMIEPNLSTDTTYSPGIGTAGGGSYVRKLTLPKNFQGRLYVAGINIGTLVSRHVKVRFKFGVTREAVTIPATVTQAPGITPQTNISVLVLDLRSEPFRSIRLPFDLYDYNEYSATETPTQDNRNTGLYCRGLRLEDDPTFEGVGACDGVPGTEECLYSYAKVLDQGLLKLSGTTKVPITPTLPQVKSTTGSIYLEDTVSEMLKKPVVDANPGATLNFSTIATGVSGTETIVFSVPSIFSSKIFVSDGGTYFYRGPYRLVNKGEWHYQVADPTVSKGLFKSSIPYDFLTHGVLPDNPSQSQLFFGSYLFPLATKIQLGAGVAHLSSTAVFGTRAATTLPVAGTTEWMDGSNARVQSRNTDLEHIGSCNVSATIEIIAKDNNGVDFIITEAKDVKLQLTRPSQLQSTDLANEVLFTNFKTCSSNASCGGSECCFNSRCWDESLVSQCVDSSNTQGNRIIGDSCTSDLECSSLCCNRTSGLCAPHNSLLSPAVLCSKPIGDFCIAQEWCQKSPVVTCLVVKTGTDPLGNTTCRQQCFTSNEFGDCKNGICVPPEQSVIPIFDANDPAACDNAVPPPNF